MDIVSKVPVEISLYILSFLSHQDLINCLQVCRRWHDLANNNLLWKRHCCPYATSDEIRKAISRVVRPAAVIVKILSYSLRPRDNFPSRNYLGSLCGCAQLFNCKYGRYLRNWRNGNFIFSEMWLREPEFNVVCSATSLTLCFYKSNMFALTELSSDGIDEVKYLDIPSPRQRQYDSVQVSSEYLIVTYKNIILVYKKSCGDYIYFKTFLLDNDCRETNKVRNFNHVSTSKNCSFIVVLISGHYAWFRSIAHIYVVHLKSGNIRKIVFKNAHIKPGKGHKVVAWSKGHIKILTVYGDVIHQRQTMSEICDVAFEERVSLLCRARKNSKPYVEWWDPQTAERIFLKRVKGKVSMVVSGEYVFILEVKRKIYHEVTAILPKSGQPYLWAETVMMNNLVFNRFPESVIFQGICGKYLFIHVPSRHNKHYYIPDMKSGKLWTSNKFAGGKPYLFNEKLVVIVKGRLIWFMNYQF